jgi:fucose permease
LIDAVISSSTEPACSQQHSRRVQWLCRGGMICIAIVAHLLPIYLVTFSATFGGTGGLSDKQHGLIGSVFFAGLIAAMLVTGPAADRLGAKAFVLLGHAMVAGGLLLLAAAPTYLALLLAVGFMGLGAGILDMILSPIVAALLPEQRTSAMNWLHAFYSMGAVATTLVGAMLTPALGRLVTAGEEMIPGAAGLAERWPTVGWRVVCLLLTAVPVALLVGFARVRIPALVAEDTARTPVRSLLGSRTFLVLLAAMLLAGASEAGMVQWLPTYAERGLGYPAWAAGLGLTAFSVAMAIGRIASGAIGRRISPVRLLMASGSAAAVLYLVAASSPSATVALLACAIMGLAASCFWPTMLAVTADRFPAGGATMYAILAAFGNAGGTVSLAIGAVADRSSLHVAIGAAAICPLLLVLLLARLHNQPSRNCR